MEQIYNLLADLHWSIQAALLFVPYLSFCWLTRKIDLDDLNLSIDDLNDYFTYRGESGFLERWRVLSPADPEGDCEDYALTAINGTGGWFLWRACNMFAYRLWHVKDPRGRRHMIAVCRHGAFDNHRKQLTDPGWYKLRGYEFLFPWPAPIILMKMLIGRFK